MIVKFSHMGIKASDYNGINCSLATALIINEAIDYLMDNHLQNMVELDVIRATGSTVDFGRETVTVAVTTISFL